MKHDGTGACVWCGAYNDPAVTDSGCDCHDRIQCNQAGQEGHWSCGWCPTHNAPQFQCGCGVRAACMAELKQA